MSLDSGYSVENGSSITIKKAAFPVFTVELNGDQLF